MLMNTLQDGEDIVDRELFQSTIQPHCLSKFIPKVAPNVILYQVFDTILGSSP